MLALQDFEAGSLEAKLDVSLGGELPTNRKWVITPVIDMGFL